MQVDTRRRFTSHVPRQNPADHLPSDIRQALGIKEGDDLEAERVEGGVMLKPVAVVDRETARRRLMEMLDGSRGGTRYVGTAPEPSDDDLMRTVVDEIKARERRRGRS